jgi:PAS domain S-box-containing protein
MNPIQPDSGEARRAQAARAVSADSVQAAKRDAARSIAKQTKRAGRRSAAMIAGIYAFCGVVWIFSSDWLLSGIVQDPRRLTFLQDYKGWAFVVITAFLLYLLLRLDARARERLEAALREQSAQIASLSANMPGIIFQSLSRPDGSTAIHFISESVRSVLGLDPAAILADSTSLFSLIHPEDRGKFARRLAATIRRRVPWHWEGRAVVNGRTLWIQSLSTPRPLPDGTTIWDGVILDVTANKQA